MKKILIGVSGIFVIIIGLFAFFVSNNKNNNEMYTSDIEEKKENSIGGFLTLMLETDADSGIYEKSTSSTWPEDGYIFNSELSKCQNGGELSWNEELGTVNLITNTSDSCYVYFDKEPDIVYLADYIINNVYVEDGVNGLYYHDESLINGASDNSYRYSGGDYKVTNIAIASGLTNIVTLSAAETTGVINFYCNGSKSYVGAYCNSSYTKYYTTSYNEAVHYLTYKEALNKAVSDGYLTANNINNYVCFGSDAETCLSDNLYRIIGVFDNKVKLIKAYVASAALLGSNGDYYGNSFPYVINSNYKGNIERTDIAVYYWNNLNSDSAYSDTGYYNVWSYSALNTINLNTNFLNNIGSLWSDKISYSNWIVDGVDESWDIFDKPAVVYDNEIKKTDNSIELTYNAKIGLMYVSDYLFSANPIYWTYLGYSLSSFPDANGNYGNKYDYRAATESNWLYSGLMEWTITRVKSSNYKNNVAFIDYNGNPHLGNATWNNGYLPVRPCFYLNSNVQYASGDGSIDNPYRIVV